MRLSTLKRGTKLMWEADIPYKDFSTGMRNYKEKKICYPIIIEDVNLKEKEYPVLIKNEYGYTWMPHSSENIRKPTPSELLNVIWPKI